MPTRRRSRGSWHARDVDVLSLQEVDADAVAELDAALRGELPSRVTALGEGTHGTALYARGTIRPLDPAHGTLNDQARALVAVPGAQAVELMAVHPLAPASAGRVDRWRADMRALPSATPDAGVRVLAGDFNATLDHAELRRLIATGYVDAASVVGEGLRPSWPVGRLLPPVTIDHVLADRRCGIRGVAVHKLPGSDHRAVIARAADPALTFSYRKVADRDRAEPPEGSATAARVPDPAAGDGLRRGSLTGARTMPGPAGSPAGGHQDQTGRVAGETTRSRR